MHFKPKTTSFLVASMSLCALLNTHVSRAKEGMKVPPKVVQSSKEMIAAGLDIPVEKLYNANGTGLNNAVVLFGKGCTGEIISGQGLLLTNHHCGYGTVQGLATPQSDYFANGFWAMNQQQELPCPGLTVTFIRSMEDVTERVLSGLGEDLREGQRDSIIAVRSKNLERGFRFTTKMDAQIKSFANGNQYWVVISETYRDIRLVGFPPNGVGQFGGDTDNWSWPRHTGDFSVFRVYAGADNKPADYNIANKPYTTKEFFTINTNGYKEGDFTLVYGFPGVTQEYISSMQLQQVVDIIDPIRIEARTRKLNVWTNHMQQDRNVFLQYTSKRASVANGWKKWQGEVRGLQMNNVVAKKQKEEQEFQAWANTDTQALFARDLLARMQVKSASRDAVINANEYVREAVFGIEIISQAAELDRILKLIESGGATGDTLAKIAKSYAAFYKNYDANTDRDVFVALMPLFMEKAGSFVPEYYRSELARFGGSYTDWADYVFGNSAAAGLERMNVLSQNATRNAIVNDPAWKLYDAMMRMRTQKISTQLTSYSDSLVRFNRLYMKARIMRSRYRELYPDANSTLRIAYGKVKGLDPDGPADYSYQTDLDGAVAKHNPEVTEFTMPQRLLELHQKKDYGRWGVNGTVPLAFIADNHTSGGNSGSPVLNAKCELIGTNFDRVWEGTMSDYYFDERWCRNISLDVRYTLFIIEKLGNAGWLLNEMKFAPVVSK